MSELQNYFDDYQTRENTLRFSEMYSGMRVIFELAAVLSFISFFGSLQIDRKINNSALFLIETVLVKSRTIVPQNFY
jgi:hypothetical protein